jgi:hypothetical protein
MIEATLTDNHRFAYDKGDLERKQLDCNLCRSILDGLLRNGVDAQSGHLKRVGAVLVDEQSRVSVLSVYVDYGKLPSDSEMC